ncbi:UDP-N-acetylmuramoyl-tripeptide--D-alanyl-D-alanine ligase [Polluticaenibacter yanchengensis]|uniref:UDP-N-acetylmuramoyl-tripeptide--D-alanyl-D-alanine ligase n=1 Tax=Polluticaenibacter yanchengensis TaxID=3014562 RepID=A0ABT4UJI7_9BACT|nr:UDP-N-acetylmuramoyl-tripeptide--D-alanyl-D-alanine ligase [Chitinophagaceae bacterium LY-5]
MISIEALYNIYLKHPKVVTDTRKIEKGCLFFALKGPNFNGNDFALKALEAGAAFSIVDEVKDNSDERVLLCSDVLSTLQALAGYHRNQLNIPVIAITGSNGKTTTKELVHAVLSSRFKTATTEGNLNNHIGIPLTLLKIKPDAEIAVVEMGANHIGEIAGYCVYTRPTHGLITNCGKAHLEGFGSIEGVRKGKGELFDYLAANNGTAFICSDFDYFQAMSAAIQKKHYYGTNPESAFQNDVVGKTIASEPLLEVEIALAGKTYKQDTQLVGSYNIYNVLAATIFGNYFGVTAEAIRTSVSEYTPSNSRSQLLEKDGNTIVLDAYNANPSSMELAIKNIGNLKTGKPKILFLGSMKELGAESEKEHQALLDLVKTFDFKNVVLVGAEFEPFKEAFTYFTSSEEAARWWKAQNDTGNYMLVKGSRGTQMEKVIL